MIGLVCIKSDGRVHIHTFNDSGARNKFVAGAADMGYQFCHKVTLRTDNAGKTIITGLG